MSQRPAIYSLPRFRPGLVVGSDHAGSGHPDGFGVFEIPVHLHEQWRGLSEDSANQGAGKELQKSEFLTKIDLFLDFKQVKLSGSCRADVLRLSNDREGVDFNDIVATTAPDSEVLPPAVLLVNLGIADLRVHLESTDGDGELLALSPRMGIRFPEHPVRLRIYPSDFLKETELLVVTSCIGR